MCLGIRSGSLVGGCKGAASVLQRVSPTIAPWAALTPLSPLCSCVFVAVAVALLPVVRPAGEPGAHRGGADGRALRLHD